MYCAFDVVDMLQVWFAHYFTLAHGREVLVVREVALKDHKSDNQSCLGLPIFGGINADGFSSVKNHPVVQSFSAARCPDACHFLARLYVLVSSNLFSCAYSFANWRIVLMSEILPMMGNFVNCPLTKFIKPDKLLLFFHEVNVVSKDRQLSCYQVDFDQYKLLAKNLWDILKGSRDNDVVFLGGRPVAAKPLHRLCILYKDSVFYLRIKDDGLVVEVFGSVSVVVNLRVVVLDRPGRIVGNIVLAASNAKSWEITDLDTPVVVADVESDCLVVESVSVTETTVCETPSFCLPVVRITSQKRFWGLISFYTVDFVSRKFRSLEDASEAQKWLQTTRNKRVKAALRKGCCVDNYLPRKIRHAANFGVLEGIPSG